MTPPPHIFAAPSTPQHHHKETGSITPLMIGIVAIWGLSLTALLGAHTITVTHTQLRTAADLAALAGANAHTNSTYLTTGLTTTTPISNPCALAADVAAQNMSETPHSVECKAGEHRGRASVTVTVQTTVLGVTLTQRATAG